MDERADFVDEDQYFFLEDLGALGEVPDVAEAKDGCFLFAFDHGVHIAGCNYVRADDFCACATEDCGEEGSYLDDGVADNSGL